MLRVGRFTLFLAMSVELFLLARAQELTVKEYTEVMKEIDELDGDGETATQSPNGGYGYMNILLYLQSYTYW